MASALPLGQAAPVDGLLPESARAGAENRDFGVYLHVPFCRVRCGYCDFNTYTATELRGLAQDDFPDLAAREIRFAAEAMRRSGLPDRDVATIFVGGGTPTLLRPGQLAFMLEAMKAEWAWDANVEVTVEANPDTVGLKEFELLAEAGVTRVSLGMQSAVPHVLEVLDRVHDSDRIPELVNHAHSAGLSVSLDLIYGAPGERLGDWDMSLETALSSSPDHVSAYALIVEEGTALARQISRGEREAPDDDLMADMYELAEERLTSAGLSWYEISNWSRTPSSRSRHNLAYWTSQDWWGVGPGAHSHVGGVRWWNAKHPAAYAQRLQQGSPAVGREILSEEQRRTERILLESRIVDGMDLTGFNRPETVAELIAEGLIEAKAALRQRLVLTLRGRLLADVVARRLID